MRSPLLMIFTRFLGGLRYPWLFAIAAGLFIIDLVIPDLLPLADEILLAAVTVLLASRKADRGTGDDGSKPPRPEIIDITPDD